MTSLKILIEKHPDGFVAYPLGVKGVVVGEGNTYEEALANVRSAIAFHVETFGVELFAGFGADEACRSCNNGNAHKGSPPENRLSSFT